MVNNLLNVVITSLCNVTTNWVVTEQFNNFSPKLVSVSSIPLTCITDDGVSPPSINAFVEHFTNAA